MRFSSAGWASPIEAVAGELRALIDNPANRWVHIPEAVQKLRKSEETLRRYCRTNTAPFTWKRDGDEENGRYVIWLPSLPETNNAASRE